MKCCVSYTDNYGLCLLLYIQRSYMKIVNTLQEEESEEEIIYDYEYKAKCRHPEINHFLSLVKCPFHWLTWKTSDRDSRGKNNLNVCPPLLQLPVTVKVLSIYFAPCLSKHFPWLCPCPCYDTYRYVSDCHYNLQSTYMSVPLSAESHCPCLTNYITNLS